MNNLTNKILKRYGLKSEKVNLSLADNVLSALVELRPYLRQSQDLIEDASGVHEEWMRMTDDLASLSQDIVELADRIADIGDVDFLAQEVSIALERYKDAADELGVEEYPTQIQEAENALDEYSSGGFNEWLYSEGSQIEEAATVANKYIP